MAQLERWLLPTPEVHGSNPAIAKNYIENCFNFNCTEKTKIKKKEAGNDPLKMIVLVMLVVNQTIFYFVCKGLKQPTKYYVNHETKILLKILLEQIYFHFVTC